MMKSISFVSGCRSVIAVVALVAVTTYALAQQPVPAQITAETPMMTGAQLQAELVGRSSKGVVISGRYRGTRWIETDRAGGSATFATNTGFSDMRVSSVIRGNALCQTLQKQSGGRETCYRTIKYGANRYASYGPDGMIASTFQVIQ
jgi:hypothetical protein